MRSAQHELIRERQRRVDAGLHGGLPAPELAVVGAVHTQRGAPGRAAGRHDAQHARALVAARFDDEARGLAGQPAQVLERMFDVAQVERVAGAQGQRLLRRGVAQGQVASRLHDDLLHATWPQLKTQHAARQILLGHLHLRGHQARCMHLRLQLLAQGFDAAHAQAGAGEGLGAGRRASLFAVFQHDRLHGEARRFARHRLTLCPGAGTRNLRRVALGLAAPALDAFGLLALHGIGTAGRLRAARRRSRQHQQRGRAKPCGPVCRNSRRRAHRRPRPAAAADATSGSTGAHPSPAVLVGRSTHCHRSLPEPALDVPSLVAPGSLDLAG
jgi:hypothetical protein